MSSNTIWAWPWWTAMVIINIVNLIVCIIVYILSLRTKDGKDSKYMKWMRNMGLIFTLVALYRSIFVSRYGSQLAWFDSIANSALLIRMFAIAAELSFSGLIAFTMIKFNTYLPATDDKNANKFKVFMTTKSPYILIICIFLAQFFATSAVITKFELLFAIEETLWSIGFLAVLPLSIIQLHRVFLIKDKDAIKRLQMLRISAIIIATWCLIYCSYGLFYHLPEIWIREITRFQTWYPPIKTGTSAIIDAFIIVNESKLYSDWGFSFLFWDSAYFSVCVWISIFLMQAPRPKDNLGKYSKKITWIILISIMLTLIILILLITLPILN